jgi:predicted ester cyclase
VGVPATGMAVKVGEIRVARVVCARFVEHWGVENTMTMMQHLGLMPERPKKSGGIYLRGR